MLLPLFTLPELRIVFFYVLLGSLWIIGSDMYVEHLVGEDPKTILLHSVKGLNFIFTTGAILFITLRRAFNGWRRSERQHVDHLETSQKRLRELSLHLQDLREDERAKISRDIHDELGQELTALKLKTRLVESALESLNSKELNPITDLVVDMGNLNDRCLESVRRVASGLRPQALDHLGLFAALEEEDHEFRGISKIDCELDYEGSADKMSKELQIVTFRITQESLTNIVRHAKATDVKIQLHIKADSLNLEVQDNGIGFDATAQTNRRGLGLLGMAERAAKYNGRLDVIKHSPGTRVSFTVPLSNYQPL